MSFLQKGLSALGRLILIGVLAATFLVGMIGVVYVQLKGEEIEIPKVVGKNFNDGGDELARYGLRIKKIASRYSEEQPNTILEQRPRAGTTAKTGLMISVVVSQENPDGSEAPASVKDDEEAIEEIEELPELKTEKPKKKTKPKSKKTGPKTRDIIEKKTDDEEKRDPSDKPVGPADPKPGSKPGGAKPLEGTKAAPDKGAKPAANKPKAGKTTPKKPNSVKPKTGGDTRPRKATKSN